MQSPALGPHHRKEEGMRPHLMKLKPPVGSRAVKGAAITGTVLASLSGLLLSQAPAYADANTIFVAVGSDTTQDVINQFSLDLGGNTLDSVYATNQVSGASHEIVTGAHEARNADGTPNALGTPAQFSFDRPNGSNEGIASLRLSINTSSTAAVPGGANPPQQGSVDIARSASAPGSNASTSGQLIYIPYALDAVTETTGSSASTITVPGTTTTVSTPASNVQGANFTLAQLQALYDNGTPETASNGVTYNPAGGPTALQAGQVAIDLYVPQSGSGNRTFWGTTLGFNTTTLPAWVFDHIQSDNGSTVSQFVGTSIQQNDGTAVTVDPNGIDPFSVADYISQSIDGHHPHFYQAVLTTVSGVSAVAGGVLNTSFPITREVYNVVQYDRVVNAGDGHFDAQLAKLLVGGNSVLCRDSATITGYGFALLNASTTDLCGSTAATLRAFATI
jgi:hypothetical protein